MLHFLVDLMFCAATSTRMCQQIGIVVEHFSALQRIAKVRLGLMR